ncbi:MULTISPECIES: DUF302 domain-containing protein [unclassified Fusibacter]|uniref:DUF302 domain-containing protein n=1 Tax=unclassified Fusibacter TaxID=2624464 RepID=UPI001011527D|nr:MULTISPECIES: DUF302 domain-containing protein [unclassified Fusibacter]MCK8059519.1 DUF302 domain-containing protein [Fusibacter sp. A2]NPE21017.1 DUF302 domain-containing protein [Fusibacter sp. A1]RXV62291.1 DUF302 domain-containing protein [Fusibacter sp. A1]
MIVHEHKSDLSFEHTLEVIKKHLPDIGFGILFELEFHEVLKSKGYPIDTRATLLEICKPALAQGVIGKDTWYAYTLPCKVVVREEKGDVFAGFLSPKDDMTARGGSEVAVVAETVEKALRSLLQNTKTIL